MSYNFEKYDNTVVNTQNTPYDYGSVMHYEPDAFSMDGRRTIEPLQSGVKIGQRYSMSPIDIQEVRLFYGCLSNGATFTPLQTTTPSRSFEIEKLPRKKKQSSLFVFDIANSLVTNTNITSTITVNSSNYVRYGGGADNYYYEAFSFRVSTSGIYKFRSYSSVDTYGYLYQTSFSPASDWVNLIAYDDDGGTRGQFEFSGYLQINRTYIIIATTYFSEITGSYTLVVSGAAAINFMMLPIVLNSNYAGSLTSTSPSYSREGLYMRCYYDAIVFTVSIDGIYTLASYSYLDTVGYLYSTYFNPSNTTQNLLTQDDESGGLLQFSLSRQLQSNRVYVLVCTTYWSYDTGSFFINAVGPGKVFFSNSNVPSVSTTTRRNGSPSIFLTGGSFSALDVSRIACLYGPILLGCLIQHLATSPIA